MVLPSHFKITGCPEFADFAHSWWKHCTSENYPCLQKMIAALPDFRHQETSDYIMQVCENNQKPAGDLVSVLDYIETSISWFSFGRNIPQCAMSTFSMANARTTTLE